MNTEFNGKLIIHADGWTETRRDFVAVKTMERWTTNSSELYYTNMSAE
jgi:hypothetical protein